MPRVGIPAEVSCDPGRGGVVVFCRATNGIDEPCPRSRTEQARLVERAKIILACLDGKRNDEVSRELGVRPNTVGVWRKRFAARGLAGLRDQPRPGKKPRYGEELRRRVLSRRELIAETAARILRL